MIIKVGLDDLRLTNVPNDKELDKEKIYYVYEWFIKPTGQVFYIGKGKGSRYKQDKNEYFIKIKEHFDCEVRFVKERLSEHEALSFEEELFAIRENEGHILTNIITPNATGAHQVAEEFTYMQTPKIYISRIYKEYFGLEDISYDPVNLEKLLKTHIRETSYWGIGKLYINTNEAIIPLEECERIVKDLSQKVTNFIENKQGKVFKSQAKAAKSVINYGNLTYNSYLALKEKGYDVYHLVDVLKFIKEQDN